MPGCVLYMLIRVSDYSGYTVVRRLSPNWHPIHASLLYTVCCVLCTVYCVPWELLFHCPVFLHVHNIMHDDYCIIIIIIIIILLRSVHCLLCTVYCVPFCTLSACTVLYAVCLYRSVRCLLCTVYCSVHCLLCTVYCVLRTILYTVCLYHSVHCLLVPFCTLSACTVLYAVCCVLCTALFGRKRTIWHMKQTTKEKPIISRRGKPCYPPGHAFLVNHVLYRVMYTLYFRPAPREGLLWPSPEVAGRRSKPTIITPL